MKKILNILSILTLSSSLSSNVISCNSKNDDSRIDSPTLSDEIYKEINATIKNYDVVSGMSNADIWNNGQDDINTLILNILQEAIAKNFYIRTMQKRATNINDTTDVNNLATDYDNYVTKLADNDLYQSYTKGIETGDYLENQIYNEGYEPDIQAKNWYVKGADDRYMIDSKNNVADWDENFDWSEDHKKEVAYSSDVNQSTIPKTTNLDEWNSIANDVVEAKKQLETRFRTYITNYLKPTLYQETLVNSFLQSGSFNVINDGEEIKPTINVNSQLFHTWQSWNTNNWYSNMKMVWEVRFTKNTDSIINDSNFKTLLKSLTNSNMNNLTNFKTAIDTFNNKTIGSTKNKDYYSFENGGDNQLGTDSIFGTPGYEGLYGITSTDDPTTAGTIFTQDTASNTDITSYKTELTTNSYTYKPGIIRDNDNIIPEIGTSPYFIDSNGDIVIAFVLPIYLMDLIQNTDTTHGISYTPFDSIKDDKINNPVSSLSQTKNDLKKIWNNILNNTKNSSDINNLKIKDGVNETQELFNLVESTIATNGISSSGADTGVALQADQSLYTWAFNGNSDYIYSSDLYDKIGKYIHDSNS